MNESVTTSLDGGYMEIVTRNNLRIDVTTISNTATIYLHGHFAFDAHRAFRAVYKNQINDTKVDSIVVNLAKVSYLDSSALGMLLVLRDQVQIAKKSLTLSRPSSFVLRTFEIASFHKMFSIN
jgi:anti-anti-sigma factor